jgi:hypothetical protein
VPLREFADWAAATPYMEVVRARYFPDRTMREWLSTLVQDLERSGAALMEDGWIANG